jgi:glycosyltransferase involved in cell wall biosynthesis
VSILPDDFTLLQVTPELETGGAEQTTIDVAHGVIAQGGKALVATKGGRMAARLEADGGRLAQMPAQSKNPLIMLGNAARMIDLIRREKVTLVHARSRAPAFSALWAAHATKVPFVATYHGVYNAKSNLKRWYNAVMTKGDLVIANSEYTRAHVIAEHGIPADRVVAIPRGVDLTRFEPGLVSAERVKALRDAWGVQAEDRRLKVLLAGRLTRWKGQGLVIEAMARLKAISDTRILLLLVGDDQGRKAYRAELEHMIAQAGLVRQRQAGGPLRRHAGRLPGRGPGHRPVAGARGLRPYGGRAAGDGQAGDGRRPRGGARDGDQWRDRLAGQAWRRRGLGRSPVQRLRIRGGPAPGHGHGGPGAGPETVFG